MLTKRLAKGIFGCWCVDQSHPVRTSCGRVRHCKACAPQVMHPTVRTGADCRSLPGPAFPGRSSAEIGKPDHRRNNELKALDAARYSFRLLRLYTSWVPKQTQGRYRLQCDCLLMQTLCLMELPGVCAIRGGEVPEGYPFASKSGAAKEVWAYGLRNPIDSPKTSIGRVPQSVTGSLW